MLREMGELLERYTENRPLLLVTEDLHWSDQATVQLMDYVARRRGAARLCGSRASASRRSSRADHPLARVRHELRLHGLCRGDRARRVLGKGSRASTLPRMLQRSRRTRTFVRALHDRTDGLPLFVADVVNDLSQAARRASIALRLRLASMPIPET